MKILGSLAIVVLAIVSTSAGFAEEPPMDPQPTKEHEALGMWLGNWKGSGEMKAGPFGPGGPMNWTEKCTWFEGSKFHVMCKSEGNSPMGPAKGMGILGYHADKGVYTHYAVDSSGWAGYSEGKLEDTTWTFQSEDTMGGMTYHSRLSMTMKSPKEMTFVWEMSEDGKNWTTMMDGVSTKKK